MCVCVCVCARARACVFSRDSAAVMSVRHSKLSLSGCGSKSYLNCTNILDKVAGLRQQGEGRVLVVSPFGLVATWLVSLGRRNAGVKPHGKGFTFTASLKTA